MSKVDAESLIHSAAAEAADDWITEIKEIAVACGDKPDDHGIRRAYRACSSGEIPAVKYCGRWRIRRSALKAHFEDVERRAVTEFRNRGIKAQEEKLRRLQSAAGE